jgi:hypothetical protein
MTRDQKKPTLILKFVEARALHLTGTACHRGNRQVAKLI